MFYLLAIGWTGQAFSGLQIIALRNAAARYLRLEKSGPTMRFKHNSLEGMITRGKEGRFGGFGGTFFHADCGLVNGERWTMDFLIPRGSENIYLGQDDTVVVSRVTQLHDGATATTEEYIKGGKVVTPQPQTRH